MKLSFCFKFVFCALILYAPDLSAQVFLNLDFEYADQERPRKWFTNGPAYQINLVQDDVHCGKQSLQISSDTASAKEFGVCTGNFPVAIARGNTLTLKGKLKTLDVELHSGLWMRVDGKEGVLQFDNMSDRSMTGTNDWVEVEVSLPVDTLATNINFGALVAGTGTIWVDCLEFVVGEVAYIEPQPRFTTPTEDEIAWLKEQIIPLKGVDPELTTTDDLETLLKVIGKPRVNALGEVTHGSREIFQMKHRLIQFLKETNDYSIFSIEANMPESYEMNNYVLEGEGDAREKLAGMYFWTWQTEEVLAMVNWMREYNAEHEERIQFTGFDCQSPDYSLRALERFINPRSREVYEALADSIVTLKQKRTTRAYPNLTSEQNTFYKKTFQVLREDIESNQEMSKPERVWALRHVRLVEQYTQINYRKRDEFMAENALWILNQSPNDKMTVWAHNAHIKQTDGAMGKYMHEALGDDYLTIGFTFYEGKFSAVGNKGLTTYQSELCAPGSYESFFEMTGEDFFALDLRSISREDPNCKWIYDNLLFRRTGAKKTKTEFVESALYDDFDIIIFIRNTTASRLLRN